MKAFFIRVRVMIIMATLVSQGQQAISSPPVFARDFTSGSRKNALQSIRFPFRSPQGQNSEGSTNRIIIKFKDTNPSPDAADRNGHRMQLVSARAGADLKYVRSMSGRADVLQLPGRLSIEQAWALSRKLMTLPDVEYAEPDQTLQPILTPNDPRYGEQWDFYDTWGINLPAAW